MVSRRRGRLTYKAEGGSQGRAGVEPVMEGDGRAASWLLPFRERCAVFVRPRVSAGAACTLGFVGLSPLATEEETCVRSAILRYFGRYAGSRI